MDKTICSDWSQQLCQGLFDLQQSNKLCDTTIEAADGSQYLIHSSVLAAASKVFSSLEGKAPFSLKCSETSGVGLELLIKLLYTGRFAEANITDDSVQEVWAAASSLDMKHVVSLCESLIRKRQCEETFKAEENEEEGGEANSMAEEYGPDNINNSSEAYLLEQNSHMVNKMELEPAANNECLLDNHFDGDNDSLVLVGEGEDNVSDLVPDLNPLPIVGGQDMEESLNPDLTIDQTNPCENSEHITNYDELTDPKIETVHIMVEQNSDTGLSENRNMYSQSVEENYEEISEYKYEDDISGKVEKEVTKAPNKRKFDPRVIQFLKGKNKKAKSLMSVKSDDCSIASESVAGSVVDMGDNREKTLTDDTWEAGGMLSSLEEELIKIGDVTAYRCNICGKQYGATQRAKSFFLKHKLTHQVESKATCKMCDTFFTSQTQLQKHMIIVHKIHDEPDIVRTILPQIDLPWNQLKEHVLKEEKLTPKLGKTLFKCSICGLEKSGYENFLGHKLRHAGVVPFSCKYCGKDFYRKTDGKRHELRATCKNSKISPKLNYTCFKKTDDGTFKNCSFIKPEEIQYLEGRKFFKCSICDRTMVAYETFFAHKFEHTGIKPFQCKYCLKEFNRRYLLKKHQKLNKECSPSSTISEQDDNTTLLNEQDNSTTNISTMYSMADIDEYNTERFKSALNILETSSHSVLMDNFELSQSGLTKDDIEDIVMTNEDKLVDSAVDCESKPNDETHKLESKSLLKGKKNRFLTLNYYILPSEKVVDSVADTVEYTCSICNVVMQSVTNFAVHKMKHLQVKPYKCVHCQKGFVRKWDLTSHMLTHKISIKFKCDDCHKTFVSLSQKKRHYKKSTNCHMPDSMKNFSAAGMKRKYQCDICSKLYASAFYLQAHKLIHTDKQLRCEICSKQFTTAAILAVHMMRHSGVKNYSCTVCNKRFVRSVDVVSHMITHSEVRHAECKLCGKTFKQKNSLKLHMLTHSQERAFICDLCGKSFTQKGNLKKHQKETHATDHNYECKTCVKRFYTEGGYRAHMKAHHSADRPYPCSHCDKKFVRRINLTRHTLTHTGQRPFSCPECKKAFRMAAHVRRHLLNMHAWSKYNTTALNTESLKVKQEDQIDDGNNMRIDAVTDFPPLQVIARDSNISVHDATKFVYVTQSIGGGHILMKQEEVLEGFSTEASSTPGVETVHVMEVENITATETPSVGQHIDKLQQHPDVKPSSIELLASANVIGEESSAGVNTSQAAAGQIITTNPLVQAALHSSQVESMQLPVAELPEDEGHQQQLLMVDTRNNQHVELPVGYRGYILTDQGMELVQVQEEEVIDETVGGNILHLQQQQHGYGTPVTNDSDVISNDNTQYVTTVRRGVDNMPDQEYILVYSEDKNVY